MIVVVKPGLLTTVQDAGRWGHQYLGVPVSGPMDPWSHARANRLVGNAAHAATLEITLAGPRLRFDRRAVIAISGGEFAAGLPGRSVPRERPLPVQEGDELEVGRCVQGARGYLAVRGGFDVFPVFGSRATHVPSAMGGVAGRALQAGDVLRIGDLVACDPDWQPRALPALPPGEAVVRVMPGPDDEDGLGVALESLLAGRFQVSPESNRMGYRLRGPALVAPVANRLSTATPMGTIQVPESGAPILLMADRQTTGGYPRVATVISADLGEAGQLKPGDWIGFARCSHADALQALRARLAEVDA